MLLRKLKEKEGKLEKKRGSRIVAVRTIMTSELKIAALNTSAQLSL